MRWLDAINAKHCMNTRKFSEFLKFFHSVHVKIFIMKPFFKIATEIEFSKDFGSDCAKVITFNTFLLEYIEILEYM